MDLKLIIGAAIIIAIVVQGFRVTSNKSNSKDSGSKSKSISSGSASTKAEEKKD